MEYTLPRGGGLWWLPAVFSEGESHSTPVGEMGGWVEGWVGATSRGGGGLCNPHHSA